MCEPSRAQLPHRELCLVCRASRLMSTQGQITPEVRVGTSYFPSFCTGCVCVSNILQDWNARMRWSRCKRPIQSSRTYSPANKISSSAPPSSDLSDSGTMSSWHLPWEVTCKVLVHLLLSLKSLSLDMPLSADPVALAFPLKNLLLSDSSYHSLVVCRQPKLTVSTSFTISS